MEIIPKNNDKSRKTEKNKARTRQTSKKYDNEIIITEDIVKEISKDKETANEILNMMYI